MHDERDDSSHFSVVQYMSRTRNSMLLEEASDSATSGSLGKVAIGLAVLALIGVAVALGFGIASYVRVTAPVVSHGERYIDTIHSVIEAPSEFVGVPVDFEYWYTKSTYQMRVVVLLPEGYNISASISDTLIYAFNILPTWACHVDPLSQASVDYPTTTGSWNAMATGMFGVSWDTPTTPSIMRLENIIANDGVWNLQLQSDGDMLDGYNLGSDGGWHTAIGDYDVALSYYIGELVYRFNAQVDRTSWAHKYDVAPH